MISTFHTPTRIGLRKDHHVKSYPDCCGERCQFRCVLNLSETEILTAQEKETVQWMASHGLILSAAPCMQCLKPMVEVIKKDSRPNRNDSHNWRCNSCKTSSSRRMNSWFEDCRCSLSKAFALIYLILTRSGERADISATCNESKKYVTKWTNWVSAVAEGYEYQRVETMKGTWHHMEADETAFSARKYHLGRRVRKEGTVWITVCIKLDKPDKGRKVLSVAAKILENLQRQHMLELIMKLSSNLPGATISTDAHKSYASIGQSVFSNVEH